MAINALCELDTPGEYYIDRVKGILYFMAPTPNYRIGINDDI